MEGLKNEVIQGMSNVLSKKLTDYTVDGKCSGCGKCCPNMLHITMSEVARIEQYVKKHNIKPHVVGVPKQNVIDATCPFLDMSKETNRCKIYPVRPHICKAFVCNRTDLNDYIKDEKLAKEERYKVSMRDTFFPSQEMQDEVSKMIADQVAAELGLSTDKKQEDK